MLQSHGGSSLHFSPLANWLATQWVSFSLCQYHPHTGTRTAWPALCPRCLYVTSISIPSALEGEDKAACHGSPYVTHLTLGDATHCFMVALWAAQFCKILSLFSLSHLTAQTCIYLTVNIALLETVLLKAPLALTHKNVPHQITKINDNLKSHFHPLRVPSPLTQIRDGREILTSVTWHWHK